MSAFDDRERAFEAKFQLDEELAFKVNARRDKLLGLWVAQQIGLTGQQAEVYARSVVYSDLADSHHDSMISKLRSDLEKVKIYMTVRELRAEMDRLLLAAREQIAGELAEGQSPSALG
jgi:hypothetical protein